jgi:bifunctional DNA-binding transcriptional regulator/antitoxin component of YhaV-PrlF toxin-antitoxin module
MICETIAKLDSYGRVKIPLSWRRENELTGGELLNITAARIELVNIDRIEVEELEKCVPGVGAPEDAKRTHTRKHPN